MAGMNSKPIVIPEFLSHLRVYFGYPVPYIQKWFDDKPDFRIINPERVIECVVEKLCGVCGRPLGEYCCFIGGPTSEQNHLFSDPPLHEECAEFASSVCPFVSGRDDGYFERAAESNAVRPELIYILKTTTKSVTPITRSGNMLIQAGEWSGVKIVPIST